MLDLPLRAFCVALLVIGCEAGHPEASAAPTGASTSPSTVLTSAPGGVAARVNGVPITTEELELALAPKSGRSGDEGADVGPDRRAQVLEALIQKEVIRQRAKALGLDDDPQFTRGRRALEARLVAFDRDELGRLFYQKELRDKAAPSDDEVRRYLEENRARISTTVTVNQIMRRGQTAGEAALAELTAGTPFETVAAAGLPAVPSGARPPWSIGPLRWVQIPDAWRPVLDQLEPGATSGLIAGPKGRYWIIQLVERRVGPEPLLEEVGAVIVERLREQRIEALRAETEGALRRAAKVEILSP